MEEVLHTICQICDLLLLLPAALTDLVLEELGYFLFLLFV